MEEENSSRELVRKGHFSVDQATNLMEVVVKYQKEAHDNLLVEVRRQRIHKVEVLTNRSNNQGVHREMGLQDLNHQG